LNNDTKIQIKRNYGFIDYRDRKEGKKAIEYMDKGIIDGMKVYVEKRIKDSNRRNRSSDNQ